MLENESIVCFAHDWNGDPTSKTHIMRILSRRNRVLWVDSIGMRRPRASASDLGRIAAKLRRGLGGIREAEPRLHVASPLVLPLPGVAAADRFNAALLAAWLRRACRRLGMSRPILWTFLPNAGRLLGRLGERMAIYHCVDEYAEFAGVPREATQRMEREIVRRADVVLTSSEALAEERRALNPRTHFVPHGVDAAHFATALDGSTRVPEEIARLPRPVVGFFGLLADWVDLPLVRSLALARPGWSFVLIGKSVTDDSPVRGVPNVHLLGRKPYALLPACCRGFDAAILPFRVNELTVRANPLKVREYLAAGLPVVAMDLPEVARFRGIVELAGGPDEFLMRLEEVLARRDAQGDRRRAEAMRSESWEARVERISAIVAERTAVAA